MRNLREKQKRRGLAGFRCINCRQFVKIPALGTRHRNHCPFCLWSKHLDRQPGDRNSACSGAMEPIGLTFKAAGDGKVGEIMVVHRCGNCGVLRKNRIAGDDQEKVIVELFHNSINLPSNNKTSQSLLEQGIKLLSANDEVEVLTQLFGKPFADNAVQRRANLPQ